VSKSINFFFYLAAGWATFFPVFSGGPGQTGGTDPF